MNQSKVSARYYLFEEVIEETPGFASLKRRRPMKELQLLAGLVWAREKGRGPCPLVRTRIQNDYSHFCNGVIHLSRAHRNLCGVLHELAHALGPNDKLTHGPAFRKRCMRLYKTYGDWNGEITW